MLIIVGVKTMSRLLLALRSYRREGASLFEDEAAQVDAQVDLLAQARRDLAAALQEPAADADKVSD